MSYPTIAIDQKKVILLSGFERKRGTNKLLIKAKEKLEEATKRHGDAVAFGFVSGRWVPAA